MNIALKCFLADVSMSDYVYLIFFDKYVRVKRKLDLCLRSNKGLTLAIFGFNFAHNEGQF